MCQRFCLLILALGGLAAPASSWAHSPQLAASPAENPLDQIAWLVGGTWTTEEKSSDGGWLLVSLQCHWGAAKHAITFSVFFESGGNTTAQYDGMFVWHPDKKKLVIWQADRKGDVAEGELTAHGDEIEQQVRVSHPDGGVHFLKAHYQRLDNDSFRFKAFFRPSESAAWQDALDVVYKRHAVVMQPRQPSISLPAELSRVLTAYEDAWKKRDSVALAQLFEEDGFVLSPGNAMVHGRRAIQQFYAGAGGPLSLRAVAYSTNGNTGYIIGAFSEHARDPDAGKFTLTLRHDGSGRWLIVSDMDNGNTLP